MAKSYFKQEHDLEKRRAEAARIREKYPDRISVIVEKAERSDIPNIDKKKYACVPCKQPHILHHTTPNSPESSPPEPSIHHTIKAARRSKPPLPPVVIVPPINNPPATVPPLSAGDGGGSGSRSGGSSPATPTTQPTCPVVSHKRGLSFTFVEINTTFVTSRVLNRRPLPYFAAALPSETAFGEFRGEQQNHDCCGLSRTREKRDCDCHDDNRTIFPLSEQLRLCLVVGDKMGRGKEKMKFKKDKLRGGSSSFSDLLERLKSFTPLTN